MSKVTKIEITFPAPVDFPPGFEQALDALIGMVCKQWERENPTMIMWPAGCGSKITHMPIAAGDERMEFDDSVYAIDCSAREDYGGQNPNNPDRERLRAEAAAARNAARANHKTSIAEQ